MALRGDDDRLRAFAGGDGAGELGDGARGVARRRRASSDAVDRQLGGVADDGLDVVGIDLALAGGVERELLDLAARQRAVGAERGRRSSSRASGVMASPCALSTSRDEAFEVVRLVGIAGDGRGLRRFLEQRAQGVVGLAGCRPRRSAWPPSVPPSSSGFSAAAVMRRPAVARTTLRAAEHRHRLQLDGEAVGIVVEFGVVEAQDLARRVVARRDDCGELLRRARLTRPASVP